jgi:hypothetical protein
MRNSNIEITIPYTKATNFSIFIVSNLSKEEMTILFCAIMEMINAYSYSSSPSKDEMANLFCILIVVTARYVSNMCTI